MAESPSGPRCIPTFRLRWSLSDAMAGAVGDGTYPVRWEPTGGSGSLANAGGRVALSPGTTAASVELRPAALTHPATLEPLVEAALGHALAAAGECFLHAAAVELGERSALLIGDSGAGKSTLAAATAAFGGRVISDDSLLLGASAGRPLVRAARRNVWLRLGSEALLPALHARGVSTRPAPDGRIRLDRDRSPNAFRQATHPDCLVLLRHDPGNGGVATRRLSQADGLTALLKGTSALYVTDERFAGRQRALLDLMTLFAERLPAIELSAGSSLLESTEECLAAITRALP